MVEQRQQITQEQIQLQNSIANNDYLKNLALSGQVGENWQQYGQVGKQAGEFLYESTVEHSPDDDTWNLLRQSGVSLTKESLRQNAMKFWGGSQKFQKSEDILAKMGYEGENKFSGKYLFELDQETAGTLIQTYMQTESSKQVANTIELINKQTVKGLESVLAEAA